MLTPPGDWGYGETYERFEGCLAEIPVPGEEGVRLWNDDLAWIDPQTGRMRGRGVIVGIKTGVHGLVARVKLMHEDVRSLQRRSTAWGEFIPHEQRVVECPVRQVQLIYPSKDVTPRRGAVVVHGGGIQHGARSLTRGARSALILWTKRICSFDVKRLPDDVRRKMLPYWTWRDQLALAAASKDSRRIVATCWSRLRPHMAQRVLDDSNPAVRRKLFGKTAPDIDRLRSVIASAPPGSRVYVTPHAGRTQVPPRPGGACEIGSRMRRPEVQASPLGHVVRPEPREGWGLLSKNSITARRLMHFPTPHRRSAATGS